jgi:hypothetical protein
MSHAIADEDAGMSIPFALNGRLVAGLCRLGVRLKL